MIGIPIMENITPIAKQVEKVKVFMVRTESCFVLWVAMFFQVSSRTLIVWSPYALVNYRNRGNTWFSYISMHFYCGLSTTKEVAGIQACRPLIILMK